ncbi:hypothetical protein DdX_18836 [Ditylenchus destructor]|uniref:Secreted protein n=1 Tax=Ditylenchus destructor TaxID=166010 RepID=A0AAD4MNR8_9BILA|nr:hypothetical protein DdX_18836 [Ditylenchus destructor]
MLLLICVIFALFLPCASKPMDESQTTFSPLRLCFEKGKEGGEKDLHRECVEFRNVIFPDGKDHKRRCRLIMPGILLTLSDHRPAFRTCPYYCSAMSYRACQERVCKILYQKKTWLGQVLQDWGVSEHCGAGVEASEKIRECETYHNATPPAHGTMDPSQRDVVKR